VPSFAADAPTGCATARRIPSEPADRSSGHEDGIPHFGNTRLSLGEAFSAVELNDERTLKPLLITAAVCYFVVLSVFLSQDPPIVSPERLSRWERGYLAKADADDDLLAGLSSVLPGRKFVSKNSGFERRRDYHCRWRA